MPYSTARVLAVLELLEAHGRMRGETLAERLEVDVRTIRRYVMTLRDRGIPVEMERGRYGGYYLPAGYKRPLALTEREALSTAWGLLSLERRHAGMVGGDSRRALTKLAQTLSQDTRDMVRSLERVVTFADAPTNTSEPVDVEHLKTVLAAVTSHTSCRWSIDAWSGEQPSVSSIHITSSIARGAGISWAIATCEGSARVPPRPHPPCYYAHVRLRPARDRCPGGCGAIDWPDALALGVSRPA